MLLFLVKIAPFINYRKKNENMIYSAVSILLNTKQMSITNIYYKIRK